MYRPFLRKLSILTLWALVVSLCMPIAAFAYTYSFRWDYPTKTLTGDIYVQDPTKVTVEAQYASGSPIVLNGNQRSGQTVYDDNNVPHYAVRFNKTLEKLPDKVVIKDNDKTFELPYKAPVSPGAPVFFDTVFKRLTPEPRIKGEQYLNSYAANCYIPPNSDLVSFTPGVKGSNAIRFEIPPYGAPNINEANLQTSDFILLNESTGMEEKVNFVGKLFSSIVLRTENEMRVGSQYKLKLSASSGSNEIMLPNAGTYNTYLYIGVLPKVENLKFLYMSIQNSVYFDEVTIKEVIVPEKIPGIILTEDDVKVTVDIHPITQRPEKVIRIDRTKLEGVINLLKDKAPDERVLTVNAKGDYSVYIVFTGDVLLWAKQTLPDMQLAVKTDIGRFQIPLSYLDVEGTAKQGKVKVEDVKVYLCVAKEHPAVGGSLSLKLIDNQASMLTDPIPIGALEEGGDYFSERVGPAALRIINISMPMDTLHMTAIGYDLETKEYHFVPAVFKRINGTTQTIIKHADNLDYTVAYSNKTFADTKFHWARKDIEMLASKLILNGVTSTQFAPDAAINRAEFTTLLVRSLGLSASKKGSPFQDVSDTDWYGGSVKAALDAGLITSSEGGRFNPGQVITREEMAVMIYRAIQKAGKQIGTSDTASVLQKFTDRGDIHSWAQGPVAEAVQAGIISGKTENTFAPNQQATRAEAAVMLKRFLQYVEYIN